MHCYWPGLEKMKPKCDIEVKKAKSEVTLQGINRLSPYGEGQENEAGFICSRPTVYKIVESNDLVLNK